MTTANAIANAPAPGTIDLAGGLRSLLDSVETEVREVSTLSSRIDELVGELNTRRDEQTRRLLVLDALRTAVDDATLGAFLDKQGIKASSPPLIVYTSTDDNGFTYQAEMPVDEPPGNHAFTRDPGYGPPARS